MPRLEGLCLLLNSEQVVAGVESALQKRWSASLPIIVEKPTSGQCFGVTDKNSKSQISDYLLMDGLLQNSVILLPQVQLPHMLILTLLIPTIRCSVLQMYT